MAKKAKAHREHRSIPYNKIKKLWEEGKSYLQIGKAIDRLATSGDLTKPTRAIISRMLNEGWTDPETNKTVILKPRQGMRNIGIGKTVASKAPKAVKKTAAKGRKKNSKGPVVLIDLHPSGSHIRVEVGNSKALPKTEDLMPVLVGVVEKGGYTVTKNATEPTAPETANPETPSTETPVTEAPATVETPVTEVPPVVENPVTDSPAAA